MKKPIKPKAKQAYFIMRSSYIDDSRFFNDGGRRIWFDKAVWTRPLLANIDAGQNPKVVLGAVADGDLDYRDFLVEILPPSVKVNEYLAAIEQSERDIASGRQLSRRQARRVLKAIKSHS